MNILAVFAHPMRRSFTGAVLDRFVQGAEQAGHAVDVDDLYAQGFEPRMSESELIAQFEGGVPPADVLAEQARYERSDALVLVFPVWWWSVPAILKGWIDRVFSAGWAYPRGEEDPSTTILAEAGRANMALCCAGGSPELYAAQGPSPGIEKQLARGLFGYAGAESATVRIFHGVRTGLDISPACAARRASCLEEAYRIGSDF